MKYAVVINLAFLFLLTNCKEEEMVVYPEGTRYTVTFDMNWDSENFPLDYPSNAHFSKLVGWSHKTTSTFFEVGTMASEGIKVMAEAGGTSPLDNEIKTKIANEEGLQYTFGSSLDRGYGEVSLDVVVNEQFPSVTIATMIAPSPDWYVAVVNINLLEEGLFVNEKIVIAHVYDAGTDDGETYKSPNSASNPKVPISLFVSPPMGDGENLITEIAEVRFVKHQ